MDLLIHKPECKTKDPKSPDTLHPLIIKNTITNYTKSYSEYKPDVFSVMATFPIYKNQIHSRQ